MAAGALVNCCLADDLKLCGTGFLDTTRIASGDSALWHDVIESNKDNIIKALDLMQSKLSDLNNAIKSNDREEILAFLENARKQRQWLIDYKLRKKQLD